MRREILIWLLGVALVAVIGYGYAQQRNIQARYVEFRENEKQLEAVRQDIDDLKRRVDQARERVENMERDPVEMEAAIRRIRRLTKDGEVIFRIEDDAAWQEEPPGQQPEQAPPPPPPAPTE